jgi:hypothetical protein
MKMSRKAQGVKRYPAVEFLGWVGVAATVSAYAAISIGVLAPTDLLYPALNIFAGVAIGTETLVHRDFQPFWLNVIWGTIALISLLRIVIAY